MNVAKQIGEVYMVGNSQAPQLQTTTLGDADFDEVKVREARKGKALASKQSSSPMVSAQGTQGSCEV